jgi:fructokinase
MEKVLCIGEALIDMICTDKGKSLAEGAHFLKKTGGAPTNVAAAVAALGGNVDIMASVGDDPFGQQLIEEMHAFGVGTDLMKKDASHFTTLAFVSLMENGERDFVFSRGADSQLTLTDFPQFQIKSYGIVHFGSATAFLDGPLRSTYLHLLSLAKKQQQFVSFDPNYRHLLFRGKEEHFINSSWEFLLQADFFKVSDEEAILLTRQSTLEDALTILQKETTACFAVTLGSKGTAFRYKEEIIEISSIAVADVKDTTGAGDAFVGAVLRQLSNYQITEMKNLDKNTWIDVIANANKAGARTCEFVGAMEAFKQLTTDIFKL